MKNFQDYLAESTAPNKAMLKDLAIKISKAIIENPLWDGTAYDDYLVKKIFGTISRFDSKNNRYTVGDNQFKIYVGATSVFYETIAPRIATAILKPSISEVLEGTVYNPKPNRYRDFFFKWDLKQ